VGEGCLERLKEKKEELEEDLDAVFKAAWDEVAESEEGVEEEEVEEGEDDEGACSRDILGSCRVAVVDFDSSPACSPSGSSSESTSSISLSSSSSGASPGTPGSFPSCSAAFSAVGLMSDWYSLHESCTCWYESGSRSWRLAASTSKQ